MTKRLVEQYVTCFFTLGDRAQLQDDDDTQVEDSVHARAYRLADAGHRRLSHYLEQHDDQNKDRSLEVPRYEMCNDDVLTETRNGEVCWGLAVYSQNALSLDAVKELRDFFEDCYKRAAEGTEVPVRYVATEKYDVFEVTETSPFAGL